MSVDAMEPTEAPAGAATAAIPRRIRELFGAPPLMPTESRDASVPFRCHHPRRRMIQYSRTRRKPRGSVSYWIIRRSLSLGSPKARPGRMMTTERRRRGKQQMCACPCPQAGRGKVNAPTPSKNALIPAFIIIDR